MKNTPDISILLEHLRLRNIPVGAAELRRLQAIFNCAPRLSRIELIGILCTVLAKDEKQRNTIERLFENLIPYEEELTTEFPVQDSITPSTILIRKTTSLIKNIATNNPNSNNNKLSVKWYKNSLKVFLSVLSIFTLVSFLESLFSGEINEITFIHSKTNWAQITPSLILFFVSGFIFLLITLKIRVPKEPQIIIRKEGRFFLPTLGNLSEYYLLNSNNRREISLGIQHSLNNHRKNTIDMPLSVSSTARRGLPIIHFHSSNRKQEVWIWQDQDSINPDLSQLADEITWILQKTKIEIQHGYFHGLPTQVFNSHREIIWSNQHEYPENQPLVIILSDINSLLQMEATWTHKEHITFSQLSHWNNLCVVDCSQKTGDLCYRLRPYMIECCMPQDISAWLIKKHNKVNNKDCQSDELHRWAVACALPDRPLMETEVRALHETLGLNCAWQYHNLKRYAREFGLGLDFTEYRHELLYEFSQLARIQSNDTQRAIQFWLHRNSKIDDYLSNQETLQKPWRESLRQRQLELDTALLRLWLSPEDAANTLYTLSSANNFSKEVEKKLNQYTFIGLDKSNESSSFPINYKTDKSIEMTSKNTLSENKKLNWIKLPYHWNDLSFRTQKKLIEAGFGKYINNFSVTLDKTNSLLLGLSIGTIITSIIYMII